VSRHNRSITFRCFLQRFERDNGPPAPGRLSTISDEHLLSLLKKNPSGKHRATTSGALPPLENRQSIAPASRPWGRAHPCEGDRIRGGRNTCTLHCGCFDETTTVWAWCPSRRWRWILTTTIFEVANVITSLIVLRCVYGFDNEAKPCSRPIAIKPTSQARAI